MVLILDIYMSMYSSPNKEYNNNNLEAMSIRISREIKKQSFLYIVNINLMSVVTIWANSMSRDRVFSTVF